MSDYKESYLGQLREVIGHRKIITTAVRAVLRDHEGRVLFIRRRDNKKWGMPAGAQELDETILESLRREVREETGLEVLGAELMAIYSNVSVVTHFGDPYHLFVSQFIVDEWSGDLVSETDETLDAKFFHLDEIPEDIPGFYHEAIDDIRKYQGKLIIK